MTIRRGENWGRALPLPHDAPVVASDAVLAQVAAPLAPDSPIGVVGGDLGRTVGTTGDRERLYGPDAHTFACDAMELIVDEQATLLAVAHVVIGHPATGSLAAICNAAWRGPWNLNPRSHPNDGRVELFDASKMPRGERVKAWRRLRTGAHVPHPDITVRSAARVEYRADRPVSYRIDSDTGGRGRHFVVQTLPDRLTIVI